MDQVEPRIRELLRAWPDMPATVIAERIGLTRSIRVLRVRVAARRPVYLPPDPASPAVYLAGNQHAVERIASHSWLVPERASWARPLMPSPYPKTSPRPARDRALRMTPRTGLAGGVSGQFGVSHLRIEAMGDCCPQARLVMWQPGELPHSCPAAGRSRVVGGPCNDVAMTDEQKNVVVPALLPCESVGDQRGHWS